MKKKLKVLEYVFIFLFLMFVCLFCTSFGDDEIWNYGFVMNIYKGLVPYKDFNMVITPFYPFLMSLPFHIFGCNELVLQITNSLLLVFVFFLLDKILGNKKFLVLFFLVFPLSLVFPSYNIFLFVLLVVLLYCEKFIKNDYLIGILIGFLFLTKQTVGGCVLIASLLYYIKDYRKALRRFIGFTIPVIIMFIYLFFNDAISDFIDLCFLGLIDFGGKNSSNHIIPKIVFFCLIINIIYYIRKRPRDIFNYYILAFYSIMIPLIDLYHVQVAFLAGVIINLYNFNFSTIYDKYLKSFCIVSCIGFSITMFTYSFPIIYPNDINHFNYRLIPRLNVKFTKKVNNHLKKYEGKNIYYLVADAYYFRIINDEKITKLDLINNGNWGYNGSKKIIKEIKKHKGKGDIFIIDEIDFEASSQIDKNTLYFIKNNCKKIDSIDFYDIYLYE